MMFDDKYNYARVGNHTNVYVGKLKTDSGEYPTIDTVTASLVSELAVKHADWTFVRNRLGSVDVYCRRELLGKIGSTYKYLKGETRRVFELYCSKFPGERRAGFKVTSDPKIAKRLAEKHFHPASDSQRLTQVLAKAAGEFSTVRWGLQGELDRLMTSEKPLIHALLEGYRAGQMPTGLSYAAVDKLLGLNARYVDVEALNNAKNARYVSLLDNGDVMYRDIDSNGENVDVRRSRYDVPDVMATNIAMLKLVNDKQLVPDIGYRFDEFTFLVLS